MNRQNYKRIIITLTLTFCLILTGVIGATLAYLNDMAAPIANQLTFINGDPDGGNDLTGQIEEPDWEPENGLDLIPGRTVPKNPMITNTSTADVSEWACLQVIYQRIDETGTAHDMTPEQVTDLLKVLELDFNTTEWEKETGVDDNANKVRYYYKAPVAQGESTEPLFTTVAVKGAEAGNDEIAALKDIAPGGVNITMAGAVLQWENLSYEDAKTEFNGLLTNELN